MSLAGLVPLVSGSHVARTLLRSLHEMRSAMSYILKHTPDGRLICEVCGLPFTVDKAYNLLCSDCLKSLRRAPLSGDQFDEIVWGARRARKFARRKLRR